jgi:hypothetical protein
MSTAGTGASQPNESRYEKYFSTISEIMKEDVNINLQDYFIDVHHWNSFNEMRDSGMSISDIMRHNE